MADKKTGSNYKKANRQAIGYSLLPLCIWELVMLIKPLGKTRQRPIALITPGYRSVTITTIEGQKMVKGPERCFQALRALQGHVVFTSGKLRNVIHTTGAQAWQAEIWRGRATSMTLDSTTLKVNSLRRVLDTLNTDLERFDALLEVSLWLSDQGVCVNSLSGMAWNLWRSTLSTPLELSFDARIGRSAFYGGRQEARNPDIYKNQVSLDISSAYPYSMAEDQYPGIMREVSKLTKLDPEVPGIARARVKVSASMPHAPLPVRLSEDMIQFQYGTFEGTWPWRELYAAWLLGAKVEILRSWAPVTMVDPFSKWWEVAYQGRSSVSPAAAQLIKGISNTLWGMFGMTGDDRALVRFFDDAGEKPELIKKVSRKMPQANTAHIAAETTSRVRTRMLLEGLYGDSRGAYIPAHVDTDGIIVGKDSVPHRVLGDGPGQWRIKTEMPSLEVMAPQLYRYLCGRDCGITHSEFHYVASGLHADSARELFNNRHPGLNISFSNGDAVLPVGPAFEQHDLDRYAIEAEYLRTILFGQPLVSVR